MASDPAPPFARVGIAGVGLIGGSIEAAIRQQWPGVHIAATDNEPVLAEARRRGLVDDVRASVLDMADRDLVVLATPVTDIVKLLPAAAELDALVTDVGSTKRAILAEARRAGVKRFIGGHPMAGAATGGVEHADAALFQSRPWILVQGASQEDGDYAALRTFVSALGARPAALDDERHDRAVAYISHLPQLLATTLMRVVSDEVGVGGLRIAGRGLEDMTRLSASPFEVWQGILETNADCVAEALHALVATLPRDASQVADVPRMRELFAQAQSAHDRYRGTRES